MGRFAKRPYNIPKKQLIIRVINFAKVSDFGKV